MSKVIYKYRVECNAPINPYVHLPISHKLIHLDYDRNNDLCVWAEVDPDDTSMCNVVLRLYGTGASWPHIEDCLSYVHLRTIVEPSGYVWHYYKPANS